MLPPQGAAVAGTTVASRGPTRSSAACDRCRLRKVKCNGKDPCLRCRQSDSICVYSKAAQQEAEPVSGAYVSMLRSQQRRLVSAVRNMSGVIDGASSSNGGSDDEDFDLTEILEKYAPCNKAKGRQLSATNVPKPKDQQSRPQSNSQKSPRKKRHLDESSPARSMSLDSIYKTTTHPSSLSDDFENIPDVAAFVPSQRNSVSEQFDLSMSLHDLSSNMPPYEAFAHVKSLASANGQVLDFQNPCDFNGTTSADGLYSKMPAGWDGYGNNGNVNNINFEQLHGMIDWGASWESCADLFPLTEA